MKKLILIILFVAIITPALAAQESDKPLRVGVVGLTHTHVHWILGRPNLGDIEIVGIVEPNRDLAQRYSDQHGYSMEIVFDTMEEMFETTAPEAVTAFGTIYEHLEVVQEAAPRGIHVMVEKPLAVSLDHAKQMKALADEHDIHLLTNYETTWYPTNHKVFEMTQKGELGDLRKVIVNDGHQGPVEIGVNEEFLEWLTDPIQNGAGALTDFGCYGANLITWLKKGERPESVFAVTQTIKPDIYPNVDDEATIILTYPDMQGIIQASWNWPVSRKDMEVYGKTGFAIAENRNNMRYQFSEDDPLVRDQLPELEYPFNDPFAIFAAVIRGELELPSYDLSSLENNMIVMEILDAAIRSAESGTRIYLD
ncbi:MAG: gfo/Idh/MocA family oxidoreductase [Balneola sp.]|nr:MAG: gfo/Idh/MocA family oxidoreductase [Balneola sp.]